jgi:hypothetical protein
MVADRTSTTVDEHLEQLDPGRRPQAEAIRALLLDNLQPGFAEVMAWGMPSYVIPLERYPDTYNGEPLVYASFAVQKNHDSLYLMCLPAGSEIETRFQQRWAGAKRLNMGKSCVRFKRLDDVDVPLLAETIASCSVEDYIALHESR